MGRGGAIGGCLAILLPRPLPLLLGHGAVRGGGGGRDRVVLSRFSDRPVAAARHGAPRLGALRLGRHLGALLAQDRETILLHGLLDLLAQLGELVEQRHGQGLPVGELSLLVVDLAARRELLLSLLDLRDTLLDGSEPAMAEQLDRAHRGLVVIARGGHRRRRGRR